MEIFSRLMKIISRQDHIDILNTLNLPNILISDLHNYRIFKYKYKAYMLDRGRGVLLCCSVTKINVSLTVDQFWIVVGFNSTILDVKSSGDLFQNWYQNKCKV